MTRCSDDGSKAPPSSVFMDINCWATTLDVSICESCSRYVLVTPTKDDDGPGLEILSRYIDVAEVAYADKADDDNDDDEEEEEQGKEWHWGRGP